MENLILAAQDLSLMEAMELQFESHITIWLGLLVASILPAFVFMFWRVEARWMALAFIASSILMNIGYSQLGLTRILGLAHIVPWLPFVAYAVRRFSLHDFKSVYGAWLRLAVLMMSISLLIDIIDLGRYAMGDDYDLKAELQSEKETIPKT